MWNKLELTRADGTKFHKQSRKTFNGINETARLRVLENTFKKMQKYKGIVNELAEGWTWELIRIDMPYDRIEILAEIKSPHQMFRKGFQIFRDGRTDEYVGNWIKNEAKTLKDLIDTNDEIGLIDYFGREVILDGNNLNR